MLETKRDAYFGAIRGFEGLLAVFASLLLETSLSPIAVTPNQQRFHTIQNLQYPPIMSLA
jgi:hypothetical protein